MTYAQQQSRSERKQRMKKVLKFNEYEKEKVIALPEDEETGAPGREYRFKLKWKDPNDVAKVPRSKQIRALGTKAKGVVEKRNAMADDGLEQPLISYDGLNGTDELIDAYTRHAAIEQYFIVPGEGKLPFWELQGQHTVEQIEDLQLFLNQDKDTTQGNDMPTIRSRLLARLANNNDMSPAEKLKECQRVVRLSAPARWSPQQRNNEAKGIFNEINGGDTSILAAIEGFNTALVKEQLVRGVNRGLYPQLDMSDFILKNNSFHSGGFHGNKSVRVLPTSDVANNIGKEGKLRYINREQTSSPGDEVHWIFFVQDSKGADDVLRKRKEAEQKAQKLMSLMMPDVKFYAWFFPQILDSVGNIEAEPPGVLIRGKSNTYGNVKKAPASTVVKFRAKK
jgi:hypothetical protein